MFVAPTLFLLLPAVDPVSQVRPAPVARTFQIAPQPLDAALERFAAQANVQVLYDRPPNPTLRSPGFTGTAPLDEVLKNLLNGTGLRAHVQATGDVILESDQASHRPTAANAPSRAPSKFRLDALEVAPVLIGEGPGEGGVQMDVTWYARLVEADVRRSLQADPAVVGQYQLTADIWIDATGCIRRARIATSSGSPASDQIISAALEAIKLEAAPPNQLHQPMRLSIRAHDR